MTTQENRWHAMPWQKAIETLQSDEERGLSRQEVQRKKKLFGHNALPQGKSESSLYILLSQLKNPLVLILVAAAIVTLAFHKYTDAIVITFAILLNTFLGYVQESKATKALGALKKILKQTAIVVREGNKKEVPQEDLVPGDIVFLAAGNKVPADARILESFDLESNEAPLTGEWIPAKKHAAVVAEDAPLADRDNMVYMGSTIEQGTGKVMVTATGLHTELGLIGELIHTITKEQTPYQKKLAAFSFVVGLIVTAIASALFIQGTLQGQNIAEMFTLAVAIAVAAIPEGLPGAITIILAIGMQRILAAKGLVRHLASAETLGSTSVIATDKTLTLTQGTMEVEDVVALSPATREDVLRCAALTVEAFIENPDAVFAQWIFRGRPTDKALLRAATETGISPGEYARQAPLLLHIPFRSETRYSASFYSTQQGIQGYVVGAPEEMLAFSSLSSKEQRQTEHTFRTLGEKGYRIVACAATRNLLKKNFEPVHALHHLVFLGFIALKDPLRKGAREAIEEARKAGVRTIMVTGDHALAAQAVARELGLGVEPEQVIEGKDLDHIKDHELQKRLPAISVFARVEPRHKLRIIEAWQKRGEVVAMTGDGINDAPALKKADIGVALGSGTDVAKEIADLVLLGDNFAIIPAAIKEGRLIVDNIKKVITYLLSGSFTETILVGASMLIPGLPLPITALQILWINLIEDGLPSIALTLEKPEKDVMTRPPQKNHTSLLDSEMKVIIFIISIITDFILLGIFLWLIQTPYNLQHVQTILFVALGLDSLFYIFSLRSLRKNIWQFNPFSNLWLIGSVLVGIVSLACAVYLPFLQTMLHTVSLSAADWMLLLFLTLVNVMLIELVKWFFIKREKYGRVHT